MESLKPEAERGTCQEKRTNPYVKSIIGQEMKLQSVGSNSTKNLLQGQTQETFKRKDIL